MASISSFSAVTITLFISLISSASGTGNRNEVIRQFVDGHNKARQAVGVPPLKWEPLLARYGRMYSNQRRHDCALIHSQHGFGENIFWGSGNQWSAKDAVHAWVDEKKFFNYSNNSCTGGECLHYTQVVWRTTKRVGCAKFFCDSGDTFIVCEYYPPGNFVGERPY